MKAYLTILVLFIIYSCTNHKLLLDKLPGNYSAMSKDYRQELLINKDGSFSYSRKILEISSQCSGTWKYLGGDSILIKCAENLNPIDATSSGNLGGHSENVLLISKNKIKINNIVLKRK